MECLVIFYFIINEMYPVNLNKRNSRRFQSKMKEVKEMECGVDLDLYVPDSRVTN